MSTTEIYYRNALKMYEDKLKELMGKEEYFKFAENVGRQCFFAEVMACPDEDFKKTVLGNWDIITATVDNLVEDANNDT